MKSLIERNVEEKIGEAGVEFDGVDFVLDSVQSVLVVRICSLTFQESKAVCIQSGLLLVKHHAEASDARRRSIYLYFGVV